MADPVTTSCRRCRAQFTLTDDDFAFYVDMGVPKPTHCPQCRERRRLFDINYLNLFKRKSDFTGNLIISHFPPQASSKVYEQKIWWSDDWDPMEYGREVDFTRPFFQQFAALHREVPVSALLTDYLHDENCAYTNYSGRNKDSYLIFDSDENRDCYYSYTIRNSRNCFDVYRSQNLELCYEVLDSRNCYRCAFLDNCENCQESGFLVNCTGCKNCFFCCNLVHKEYYVHNKPVAPEKFAQMHAALAKHSTLKNLHSSFDKFRARFPERALRGFHNENVSGDYLVHCKDSHFCFDCLDMRDCKYCTQVFMPLNDCRDCYCTGEGELLYECSHVGYNAYNLRFCAQGVTDIRDLTYCSSCFNGCHDLFGCTGLRKKSHCILNKPYPKREYEALIPRLIEHMEKTGEWGEFFPAEVSLTPYNISMAQEYFPMTKAEALAEGFGWLDEDQKQYEPQTYEVPDEITEVHDDLTTSLLTCLGCGKNFKILVQELNFYRLLGIAVPRTCFFCRHRARARRRYPRSLWTSQCAFCGIEISTSCAPDKGRAVYCEKCFADALA
jgi:CxxC-x17-CxxC domain-containing protein